MAKRTWPPPDLIPYVEELRRLILADRETYVRLQHEIGYWDPKLWVAVGKALKARARYYRAEIIRAKNDTQRYALGENPKKPSKYGKMVCDWLTQYLEADFEPGFRDDALSDLAIAHFEDVTKDLERITYGG